MIVIEGCTDIKIGNLVTNCSKCGHVNSSSFDSNKDGNIKCEKCGTALVETK